LISEAGDVELVTQAISKREEGKKVKTKNVNYREVLSSVQKLQEKLRKRKTEPTNISEARVRLAKSLAELRQQEQENLSENREIVEEEEEVEEVEDNDDEEFAYENVALANQKIREIMEYRSNLNEGEIEIIEEDLKDDVEEQEESGRAKGDEEEEETKIAEMTEKTQMINKLLELLKEENNNT
jgi:hypothetical protein